MPLESVPFNFQDFVVSFQGPLHKVRLLGAGVLAIGFVVFHSDFCSSCSLGLRFKVLIISLFIMAP